ncbi:putative ribonuclease H-like domain-containing protein [Tanacetum coccineum]
MTHPHPKRSFVLQAVLTRLEKLSTAGVAVNTVRPVNTANTIAINTVRSVNTAASKLIVNHPRTKTNAFKRGYSQSLRPFNRHFINKNSIINTNVNTARVKHTTARDRVVGNPQQKEYKKAVIDSGCSRHMAGNKCYLDEYEDYDGGFVSFGDGKGRISRKGKIKTGSLDFDDVYFCKKLKYNMGLRGKFSVARTPQQHGVAERKNRTLIEGTKLIVLQETKDNIVAGQAQKEKEPEQEYILIPLCTTDPLISQGPKDYEGDAGMKLQILWINTVSTPVSTAGPSFDTTVPSTPVNTAGPSVSTAIELTASQHTFDVKFFFISKMHLPVSTCPIYLSNDNTGIFGMLMMMKILDERLIMNNFHKLRRTNHKDFQNCLFACFLSQMEPKKPVQALKDPSWVEAMQDELLQFKLLKVWTLVDLPRDKWAIGTKWVFRNKKDERGIVVKNKARLVAQGHTQEEGINYDEVFYTSLKELKISLFLAFASFQGFVFYQMDVKKYLFYMEVTEMGGVVCSTS